MNGPIRLKPNLRLSKSGEASGYTWGKSAKNSNILKLLGFKPGDPAFAISPEDIVAELWIASDDAVFASQAVLADGREVRLPELLRERGDEILGKEHVKRYGHSLACVMKYLDTHEEEGRGSLSTQVHPPAGYSGFPPRLEMWKGSGRVYLGWNQDMSEEGLRKAVQDSRLEAYLNPVELTADKPLIVHGGCIHAVRSGSYLAEWSTAPFEKELTGGNLADATVALYDRTDGKKPRPGKENPDLALRIMRDAGTLKKTKPSFSTVTERYRDYEDNRILNLFDLDRIVVDEIHIRTRVFLDVSIQGVPLFVESGRVRLRGRRNEDWGLAVQGDALIIPASLKDCKLENESKDLSVVYRWHAPLGPKFF